MSSKKSMLVQFVEANQKMLDCYNQIDQSQYADENAARSANVCMSQREKVKEILRSNELNMTRTVTERIAILREMDKKPRREPISDDMVRILR